MTIEPSIQGINNIFRSLDLNDTIATIQRMSGTTNGVVFRLESNEGNKYILKFDAPSQIQLVEHLLITYQGSALLPEVLFTADDKSHYIYTYISGATHFNRGVKKNWLTILVKELINKYSEYESKNIWGRLHYPCRSWYEFNEISIEEARINIGSILTTDDYLFVKSQVNKLFNEDEVQGGRYLLHGDTGVHNFVFDQNALVGVIDPSPMAGPLIYDFIYAFCSSPDDITIDTLFTAYHHLSRGRIDKRRLIQEVSVQLYCRVGLSIKHHPNDLSEYLAAWGQWKKLCKQFEEGIGIT